MKLKKIISCFAMALTAMSFVGCGDMDETFKEFWADGKIDYAGIVQDVVFYPGRERARISFMVADPTLTKARVYWNNKTEYVDVDIDTKVTYGPYYADLPNMKEATYSFQIVTFNATGGQSMDVDVPGRVYGTQYEGTLLNTPIRTASEIEGSPEKVDVKWGVPDETSIYSEITYTPLEGEEKMIKVNPLQGNYLIEDYKSGTPITYRAIYQPDSLCMDVFYSPYDECKVLGAMKKYDRTGWIADGPAGDARTPQNLLDGNPATEWLQPKNTSYPKVVTIDMKQELLCNGFWYINRDGSYRVKDVNTYYSLDGENWTFVSKYTWENNGAEHSEEFKEPFTARYIKLEFLSDWSNGKFGLAREFGIYWR